MSLPVIVIVTSGQCGHCLNVRGNGFLMAPDARPSIKGRDQRGWAWNEELMRALIRGGDATAGSSEPKFRLFDVFFATLAPTAIQEFSEYTLLPDGHVQRIMHASTPTGGLTTMTTIGYTTTIPRPNIQNGIMYADALKDALPANLGDFVFAYPGWLYFDGKIWDAAIEKGDPLYAQAMGLSVIPKPGGGYMVDRRREAMGIMGDPVKMAHDVATGKISLRPSGVSFTAAPPVPSPPSALAKDYFQLYPML